MSTNEVTREARRLQDNYKRRDGYFQTVDKLLALEDDYENPLDVERFTSNDPRTLWNMATFLLQPRPLIHDVTDVDGRELAGEIRTAAEVLEQFLNRQWATINEQHMRRGGDGLYWDIVGTLAATGWYAVPYGIDRRRLEVDHWRPDTVYPEWSDDVYIGLVKLARIRTISSSEALRIANSNNWYWGDYQENKTVVEYRLWDYNGSNVRYGVSFDNNLVRPMTEIAGLDRIPVVVGGVGGLPSLKNVSYNVSQADRPQRGASVLETNRKIYSKFDRQMSFVAQLARDTATPKTFERRSSNRGKIVQSPEHFYTPGAHFELDEDDELGVIQMPQIPPEAFQLLLTMRNMIQRGGFSDTAYGNITGQVTALVISQAAEAAQQIIIPYHQAMEYICTEVSRYWISNIQANPGRYGFLSEAERSAFEVLGEDDVNYLVKSQYAVQVPGDTAARIVMMRQASPRAELSPETAMRLFMPEVTDPQLEISRVRASRADDHPAFELVRVANAMREAANEVAPVNGSLAQTLTRGAEALLSQLGAPAQQQGPGGNPRQDNQAGGNLSGVGAGDLSGQSSSASVSPGSEAQ